jgi:hypothetical protein
MLYLKLQAGNMASPHEFVRAGQLIGGRFFEMLRLVIIMGGTFLCLFG